MSDEPITQTAGPGTLTSTRQPLSPRDAAAPITEGAPRNTGEIPPSLYARFEDFQVLGRGGMGTVYRARDLRLGRTVAVKLLFHEGSGGGLLKEARSQARLTHPNICEVYEAGNADGVPFIVMRFIAGAPLSQLRAEMSLEEKVSAVRDAALALHEAHRAGLIHRDVKPGNLLVEREEDGRYHAFVCDFGIARDTSDTTATVADAVHGTPAYMAPEQALGKARSLDRRTDVYGLGATLYDTIAEAPPLTAPSVVALLKAVIEVEPRPLRAKIPTIPVDLDAIVMKCLEKDPGGRYESAKALAEDLQRFLDGDPVRARPTSWGARLYRRAKKHRGKVAVGAAVLLAGLTLGGLWIRDRRVAGERAALAREMGGVVREMELFLRAAHTLPLHDVERERDVVRGRLRDIESRMTASGDIGQGPGHDALGRGYLALQDPKAAILHLELAKKTGEDAAGLEYAMGLARIALYREALERANRIQTEAEKKAYLAAIEKEHREPALAHLRAAITRGVESPAYAHGLVALTEGRPEEALSRAKEAFEAAPWLYEAKKLEGDALLALGNQTGHDKAFDAARTKGYYDRAAEAYRAAADVGRSDPSVHEAECDLWIKAMNAAAEAGASMQPGFESANRACERAIAASSRRGAGRVKLAWAHNSFAFWVAVAHRSEGGGPEAVLDAAARKVEEAFGASPDDAFVAYLAGSFWRYTAYYQSDIGRDELSAIERALVGFDRALALDPGFLWALNEKCGTLALRGRREARLGADPTATNEKALSICARANEIDGAFMFPRNTALYVRYYDAERLRDLGLSPARPLEAGLAMIEGAEKLDPGWDWGVYYRAAFHRIAAEHALAKGQDPTAEIAAEREAASKLAPHRASFSEADAVDGELWTLTAESLLAKPAAPGPRPELEEALSKARAAFGRMRAGTPWSIDYSVWLARVELDEIRYRLALGAATPAHFDAALAPLTPLLAEPREEPRLYLVAAKIREEKALFEIARRRDPAAEIERCLEMANLAVVKGPGVPEGRAVLGRCEGMKAKAASLPGRK